MARRFSRFRRSPDCGMSAVNCSWWTLYPNSGSRPVSISSTMARTSCSSILASSFCEGGADGRMRGGADVALWVGCGGAVVVEFRILGPLEVLDGAAPVAVPGAKERALLADLLVHAGRVVAVDRLVEDLWGEEPPRNPANTLQGRVSALRRALGPSGAALLVTRPPGYLLAVEPEGLDAARFQQLAAEADADAAGEGPRAARLIEAPLALWRGPAPAEFAHPPRAR